MDFVPYYNVPKNIKVAYTNMVYDYRPTKTEKYCAWLTIGGDVLDLLGSTAFPDALLIETTMKKS